MLNSISRSALYKLFLALGFLLLFGASVRALRAQPEGLASQVGPSDAQAVQVTPTVQFSMDTYPVAEDVGTAIITVELSEAYTDTTEVSVNYTTMGTGSATAGSDYIATTSSLTILAGETTGTFGVDVIDDAVDETLETVNLQITGATNADLGTRLDATLEISDNDTAGFDVNPQSRTISEPDGSTTFNISLTSEPTADVSIGLSTDDSTECTVPVTEAVLDSTNWDIGVDVTVNAVDDSIIDGPQECIVQTAAATSTDGSYDGEDPANVTVTVNDDDTADIVVEPTELTVSEPDGFDSFIIRLTSRPSNPVNIGLLTSNSQCSLSTGTVTLNTNDWEGGEAVIVSAEDDDVVDGIQTCLVETEAASSSDDNYDTQNPDDVSVTVNDDDTAAIVVSPLTRTISEPDGSTTFNISLTSEPTANVSIGLGTDDNTECTVPASEAVLTSVNWEAGVDVTVNAEDDLVVDGAQTCIVQTAAATSGDGNYNNMNPADVTVTVNDDDSTSVQFSDATYSVSESGGSALITVTLSTASSTAIDVGYATGPGPTNPATAGSDYTASSGTVTIQPEETSATFTVPILHDELDEPNETVSLTLNPPTGVPLGSPGTATLTILDDDLRPTVQFSSNRYLADEDAGTQQIQVTLSAASELPVSVRLTSSDGSPPATGGVDYAVISDTITFDPGETTKPYPVSILDDVSNERDERVELSLSSPTNATLGTPNPAEVIILDDDDPPVVQFANATYSVNEAEGSATITVTLSAASGFVVTVDYATVAGGNATAGSDYTAVNGTVVFSAGQVSKTFTVPINDDLLDEVNETVNLTLSDPINATLDPLGSDAVLTIIDNEGTPTIQFNPVTFSANEGLTATISVALSAPSGQTVTVDYATSNGSATAGSDYLAANGTLTFAPGEVNKTFKVPTLSDQVIEGDETVNLTLSNPNMHAQLGTPNDKAVLTIVDTSGAATVQFSQANFNVPEASLTGNMTVTLSTQSAFTVTVNYTMTNGTATTGEDYAPAGGTLTFAPGQVRRTIVVPIFTDELDEADETVILNLSDPVNAGLGVPKSGTLTILDDDPPPSVQFAAASQSASEADGASNVTVQLSAASGRTVTVDYATVDGTAKAGNDYGVISGTLVFNPGERSKIVSVPIMDDDVDEPDESFVLTLSNPGNATLGTPGSVTVMIFDSDLPIFTYYYPMLFFEHVVGEPNDTCSTAYPITAARPYDFLPDDQNDWYQFDLATSGNLVVEVTNFVPLKGQVAVYKGENCVVDVLGNYAFDGTTKTVDAGIQTAGHYYVYVSNDGVFNDTTPYQLYVRFP